MCAPYLYVHEMHCNGRRARDTDMEPLPVHVRRTLVYFGFTLYFIWFTRDQAQQVGRGCVWVSVRP